jgi:hypothetical protein
MDRPGLKAGLRCRSCEIQLANPETRSSSQLLFLPPGGFGGLGGLPPPMTCPVPWSLRDGQRPKGRADRRTV